MAKNCPDTIPKRYYITITFKTDPHRLPHKQLAITLPKVYTHFVKWCLEWKLVAEYTLSGRIHYHASYSCASRYRQLKLIAALKLYGFIKNEVIKNYAHINAYLEKDLQTILKILRKDFGFIDLSLPDCIFDNTQETRSLVKHMKQFTTKHINPFINL